MDEALDIGDAIKIFRKHFRIVNFYMKGVFEKSDDLEYAGRINDAGIQKRSRIGEGIALPH